MCVYFVAMLCADRFGLGWAHDAFIFICHMFIHFHVYVPSSFYICYIVSCWCFSDCLSFSPSLFVSYVSCVMAPKRKSIPSWNPFRFKASSSSSPFDPSPSQVRFRDEEAKSDFLDNFSWRGIHSECQVILLDFYDTYLPIVIHTRVGSHFVASQSHALPWSYRSSTPICTDLITLYPSLSLAFGVYTW